MGMRGQAVVGVLGDLMILLAGFIHGIDMHGDSTEIAHLVEEMVADLFRNGMPLRHRKRRLHRNVDFGTQDMPEPARLHLCDGLYS